MPHVKKYIAIRTFVQPEKECLTIRATKRLNTTFRFVLFIQYARSEVTENLRLWNIMACTLCIYCTWTSRLACCIKNRNLDNKINQAYQRCPLQHLLLSTHMVSKHPLTFGLPDKSGFADLSCVLSTMLTELSVFLADDPSGKRDFIWFCKDCALI